MAKKEKGEKDDKEKSNLIPAVVVAIGAVLGAKFAAGGSSSSSSAATVTTEASAKSSSESKSGSEAKSSGESTDTTEAGASETTAAEQGSGDGASSETTAAEAKKTETTKAAGHWSYEGDTGPTHWGELSKDYTACADGSAQSPIDIKNPQSFNLPDVQFSYVSATPNVKNNGHTIVAEFPEGSGIDLDGQHYNLVQMHFHDPSEHTVDGKQSPMEIHLVHKNADGKLAVVGLLVNEGAANPALDPILSVMPAEENATKPASGAVDLGPLLPEDKTAIRYDGSLTTPPCSEGVRWVVLKQPIELSKEQIAEVAKLFAGNNRPVQKVDGRAVLVDSGPDK